MDSQNKLLENAEDIRLNENLDLQQILGSPPGWILRWGILVVFVAVIILGVISYVVKYPDKIPARVSLTTEQPPIRVVAKTSGKIESLNIKDNQLVKTGDLLAVIENPADPKDIQVLDRFLSSIQNANTIQSIRQLTLPRNLQLGALQNDFADFSKKFDNYLFYLQNNITFQKVENLKQQNQQLDSLSQSIEKQKLTYEEIVKLALKELNRNKELIKIGGVADSELETFESKYLQQQQILENMNTTIIRNNIQIEQNNMQILEAQKSNSENQNTGLFNIQEDIQKMKNGVETWNQDFLVIASIDGKVSLAKFWSPQQYINANEELLTIVPINNSGKIIGKAILPLARSGKVEPGMPANIRLDAYPYQEFGSIETRVAQIALIPQDNAYQIILEVPATLVTTYGKAVPFRQEMQGTANIITEDRRIIERIFDKILSLLKNE